MIALIGIARDAAPQQRQPATEQAETELGLDPLGASISELRERGLDIVLVIDRTGSMKLIIDDVKAQMGQLMQAIHRFVPLAEVGIVAFGAKGEKMNILPLTLSPQKMTDFLNDLQTTEGSNWDVDTIGAVETAINKMDWKPYAKRMVVLIGDSPLRKEDYSPVLALIRTFKGNNGTFNAIDVAAEEHERFVREWMQAHPDKPTEFPPLPEFYRQTAPAYRVLAAAGDGKMWELSHDLSIDQLIFLLVLPEPLVSPEPLPNDYVHPAATVPAPDSELHCQTRKDQQADQTCSTGIAIPCCGGRRR